MTLSLGVPVYVFVLAPYACGILFVLLWLWRSIDILDGTFPSTDLSELKIALSIFFHSNFRHVGFYLIIYVKNPWNFNGDYNKFVKTFQYHCHFVVFVICIVLLLFMVLCLYSSYTM